MEAPCFDLVFRDARTQARNPMRSRRDPSHVADTAPNLHLGVEGQTSHRSEQRDASLGVVL
jgi:hypothetical protein